MKGTIRAENRDLYLSELSGKVGKKGQLEAHGRIALDRQQQFPYTLDLTLHDTLLLQTDLLEATTDGKLILSGTTRSNQLEGILTFVDTAINIPRHVRHTSSTFEIKDIDTSPHPLPVLPRKTAPLPVSFDLMLRFPNRLYVRGRGLDSEWSGSLTMKGSTAKPIVAGTLTNHRGKFAFFGQNFQLGESTIDFDGASPPTPQLDVQAVRERTDIIATLRMSGPLTSPVISISSVPELPTEEVLSGILFGKEAASISPMQAVTIARAAYTLESGGSALDFMGLARKLLFVDQLDFREDENPDSLAEVTAGKYISDRVFLQGETAIGRTDGQLLLEVEISPRFSIESNIGSDLRRGIGVNWKRDF